TQPVLLGDLASNARVRNVPPNLTNLVSEQVTSPNKQVADFHVSRALRAGSVYVSVVHIPVPGCYLVWFSAPFNLDQAVFLIQPWVIRLIVRDLCPNVCNSVPAEVLLDQHVGGGGIHSLPTNSYLEMDITPGHSGS